MLSRFANGLSSMRSKSGILRRSQPVHRTLMTTAFADVPASVLTFQSSAKFASILCDFQATTQLPWWVTLICGTVIFRTILVMPTQFYAQHIIRKLGSIQPELTAAFKRVQEEVRASHIVKGWSNKQARRVLKQRIVDARNDIYAKHNCHPFKSFILIPYELALWIYISVCLRDTIVIREHYYTRGFNLDEIVNGSSSSSSTMREHLETRMRCLNELAKLPHGGTLWFGNLCVRDSFYILPAVFCGLLLFTLNNAFRHFSSHQLAKFEALQQVRMRLNTASPKGVNEKAVTDRLRVFGRIQKVLSLSAVASVFYVICGLPAFVNFFWCVSSAHALCVKRLLPMLIRRFTKGS